MEPGQYPPQGAQQHGYPPQGQQPGYPQQPGGGRPQPGPAAANPRIQEALGQVDLLAGEQIVYVLPADGFFLGANPIAKMIASFQSFMVTITGGYIRIFMVVTNQRLLVIQAMQQFCGCTRVRAVHTVALAGVKEVGSSRETHMCCVNTRVVHVQSMTQVFNVVVKKLGDAEIRNFVTNLSAVIVAHTGRASV